MAKNKIVYADIAPEAKRDATPSMDVAPFCDVDDLLLDTITVPKVATGEPNYWKLDGTFDVFPNSPNGKTWGAWSSTKCGNDGAFATPPVLTVGFSELQSSVGLTFNFDSHDACYCNELYIQWFRSNSEITHATFYPDKVSFACILEVRLYDKVVITFRCLSKPRRTLKLFSIIFGIMREFEHDEIKNGKVYLKSSLLSESLEISTFDFDLIASESVPFMYQEGQPLYAYNGEKLISLFFITSSKQSGTNSWKLKTQNLVGMLDTAEHQGGIYTGETVAVVVADILGDYPYTIDGSISTATVHGWLPYSTKRANLQQLCFAIGAVVDTSNTDRILIRKKPTDTTRFFSTSRLYQGGSIENNKIVTAVNVTEHKYNESAETADIYKGTIDGTVKVAFSEPYHDLTITGGTIVESGANYAIISGEGDVVLSGDKYADDSRVITKRNPNVAAGDKQNVREVTSAFLVTPENSADVVQRVYDYVMMTSQIKQSVIWDGERPSERVETTTSFSGDYAGYIEALTMTLGNTVKADVVIVGIETTQATVETPYVNEFYVGDVG